MKNKYLYWLGIIIALFYGKILGVIIFHFIWKALEHLDDDNNYYDDNLDL